MSDPFSNTPVLPGTTLQPTDIRPYQAGVTQATQALQNALSQGIVDYKDLLDAGLVAPKAARAKGAEADLATRRAQAEMNTGLPELQAQGQAANVNAGLQVLPSRTGAAIAGNNANAAQSGLTQVQIAGQQPGDELTASEMKQDPTGMTTAARRIYSQFSFGNPLPRKQDGSLDYDSMRGQLGGVYGPDGVHSMMMSSLWNTDQGKSVAAMAKEKNREDLMLGPEGKLRSPYEAQADIARAEVKPKLTADAITGAATSLPQQDATLGLFKEAHALVNKPGTVGPEHANKVYDAANEAHAAAPDWFPGSKNARAVKTDRDKLHNTIGEAIINTIRTLGAAHAGRVLGKEFETIKTETVPEVGNTPEYWNDWLNKKEDLLNKVIKVNQDVAAGRLPSEGAAAPAAAAPAGNAAAAPQGNANASLPKVMTQSDYDALKPGMKYVDSAGNVATKRGQQ